VKVLRKAVCAAALAAATAVSSAAADPSASKLLSEGRVDDAVSLLQRRVNSVPGDAQSYSFLCRAYDMLEDWNAGVAACEKAVSLDPNNGEYHSWLGRIYGDKASHSNFLTAAHLAGKVRTEFEAAVRINPQSVDARADLADFYLQAPGIFGGGKDKAEAQAREIAKVDPAQAYRVTARIAEDRKDYAAAQNDYRLAIQSSGGKAGTWLNLARFYERRGRMDEMEDAIRRATAPEKNRPDLLLDAAQILIDRRRNPSEAAGLLRRYLSSSGTVEEAPIFRAHYLLGRILEKEGNQPEAAEQYQAALSLAGNYVPAEDALHRLKFPAAH